MVTLVYCSKCGAQVDETMTFCPRCGAPLKTEKPQIFTEQRRDQWERRRDEKAEKQEKHEKH
ncbi:MAG: zinc-ribbon domain-containing protein [Candidatus Bathyarchaeota archaeon]